MVRKIILCLSCCAITASCSIKNISRVNVCHTLVELKGNFKLVNVKKRDYLIQQILYKNKAGNIFQKHNDHFGYWYRIRRGDSLYRISKRAGVTITHLAKVNQISRKAKLRLHGFLFIPVSETYLEKYTEKLQIQFKAGKFIWPLWGRITSKFGLRWKRLHKGIDIAAPLGTKIVASDNGQVTFSGKKKKYGYIIIIDHINDFQTRYAHLSKPLAKLGDTIQKGQVIGFVGKTGRATGYHLHFEIRFMGQPVDPQDYLPDAPNDLVKIYSKEAFGGLRP
ncbi:MAG: peptidoglycan DD-metalloendopeptidase family protein [Spirochaetes bacterium]|nr:peptidoglycan DD-metalloendopeptidase family protein [Spirochaetota bacterium]